MRPGDDAVAPPSWEDQQEAKAIYAERGSQEDRFGDTAAAMAGDSFQAAKDRFMKAGSREGTAGLFPESDSKLLTGYQSAMGYLADTGLSGIELADAAFKYALGIGAEAIPGQGNNAEERFVRDAYSIPEAFGGSPASVGRATTKLDDILMGGQRAVEDVASTYDPNQTNIFLGMKSKGSDHKKLGRASAMEQDGVDRETIWKDTGWFKFNGEWLYEIDDSKSEIALTAKKKGLDKATIGGETTTTTTTAKPPSTNDRLKVQNEYQQKAREIRNRMRKGELDDADGQSQLATLQTELDTRLGSLTGTATTTTTKSTTRPHPAGKLTVRGTLDDVLYHPSLKENVDIPDDISAEAGRRKSPSSYRGVYYPRGTPESYLKEKGLSRVNSFKDAGSEDGIWSTFLHETQHLVDDLGGSSMGGSNLGNANDLLSRLQTKVRGYQKALETDDRTQESRSKFQSRIDKQSIGQAQFSKLMTFIADGNPEAASAYLSPIIGKSTAETRSILRQADRDGDFSAATPAYTALVNDKAYIVSKLDKDYPMYAHEGGEVKARMVQARRKMTPEERVAEAPWKTMKQMEGPIADERAIYSERDFPNSRSSSGPLTDTDDLERADP